MNDLTPEQYQELLGLGAQNQDLEAQIAMQMQQAKLMREGNRPQMREAGRVTRAPHWMELLGGLAREKVGGDLSRQAQSGQKQMTANQSAQNALIMQNILRGAQQPPPADPAMGLKPPRPPSPFSFGSQ